VNKMAECIVKLLEDANLRRRMGMNARQKVFQRHDVEVAAPRIAAIINATLSRRSGLSMVSRAQVRPENVQAEAPVRFV